MRGCGIFLLHQKIHQRLGKKSIFDLKLAEKSLVITSWEKKMKTKTICFAFLLLGPGFFACEQKNGGTASPKELTVEGKEFIESFVSAQKCKLNEEAKLGAIKNVEEAPTAEDVARAFKILDGKSKDEKNNSSAWNIIASACKEQEISSMKNYFECHNKACAATSLEAAESKHRECSDPTAADACKKAFMEFRYYFTPF